MPRSIAFHTKCAPWLDRFRYLGSQSTERYFFTCLYHAMRRNSYVDLTWKQIMATFLTFTVNRYLQLNNLESSCCYIIHLVMLITKEQFKFYYLRIRFLLLLILYNSNFCYSC
ncbi:hypothetical protein Scep_023473 [Stephania cephalantha]|uniref:Uncharacterized protein n=1 Tax=Stephania cephalantha TaxID=152367 RepID=A0AAP0F1X3_9MAGN